MSAALRNEKSRAEELQLALTNEKRQAEALKHAKDRADQLRNVNKGNGVGFMWRKFRINEEIHLSD